MDTVRDCRETAKSATHPSDLIAGKKAQINCGRKKEVESARKASSVTFGCRSEEICVECERRRRFGTGRRCGNKERKGRRKGQEIATSDSRVIIADGPGHP